jgi:Aspartyl protease/PDZ domain
MRHLLTALVVLVLAASASAAPLPDAAQILQRSKAAQGGSAWDDVRTIRTKMRIETSGLKGTGESFEDARSGAFVDTFELGAFKGASGFDGTTAWEKDTSGQIVIQSGDGQRQSAINEAYRRSHSFWYADRMQAAVTYAGETPDGKRKLHVIKITPKGGRPFDLWIDAKTFLIDRITERNSQELRTTFLTDYRIVSGKLLPFASRQTNGEVKFDTLVAIDSVAFEGEAPVAAFSPPAPPKRDFGFTGISKSTAFPFRLINNHIYLDVRLNGRPYEFLFDTGGLNVITPTVARELGLKTEGAIQARGVGEKSVEAGFTVVDRLDVGAAFLEKQTFVVVALESFKEVEGKPITGIVGYEIFKRFVVTTDYQNSRVTLRDPEGFAYRGPGVRVEMGLNERTPEVAGEIDGLPGKFTLDTGSRSTLDLSSPFVEKHGLIARYGAKYQGVTGWGVGGATRSWIVRGKKFSLGGASVEAPVVELSQSKAGSLSNEYLAGNVGAGVLKKFNIVWDYSRHEIFFEPNKLHAERDVYDRAGFWVNLGDGGFDVVDVVAGAPADEAGLKVGDRIIGINGKKAGGQITLPDFRLLKKAPVGTNLILQVQRGAQTLTINVTLRDLV